MSRRSHDAILIGAEIKPSVTRFLAHSGFWLATLVLTAIGWAVYGASSQETESSRWVSHTQEVLQAAAEVDESVSRAESAQRGYLLTGVDAYLAERDQALAKVDGAVARIKQLTLDNPVQRSRLPELEKLIVERVAIMQENARLRQTEGIEAARLRAASGVGQQASARIYDLTGGLKQDEGRLLDLRRADQRQKLDFERNVLVAAALAAILALIPGYLGFALQARARDLSEQKLRTMADSLPGAMYQLRHDAHAKPEFVFMGAGLANLHGTGAAGPAGALPDWEMVVNAIDERDRSAVLVALADAMRSLAAFRQDYRIRHADGGVRWLHDEASMQRQPDGGVLMNGYIADVTEQKRLEDALQQAKETADSANRAKSSFLATMSHEIRTPLNGMLGMLELLGLSHLDAGQRATLAIVSESSRSLLRIINDILDFSKIEAGRLDVRPEVAAIRDVIEDVHNIYSGNASSKGLLIKRHIDPRISPAVRVDPVRLRQVLNNLVSNALKFTSRGSVEIKAELVARVDQVERVRFSVTDTGAGISAENQQLLFQPFSQGDSDRARRAGGTGLGLTICRRLAELMGGSVEMASELGKGTTMTLLLPLPIADPADLPKTDLDSARDLLSTTTSMRRMAPSMDAAEAEGTLALLVDDHTTNRLLLMRQVHALGYAAQSAENGAEALELWKTGRFGIVITDCNMPEMDGYDLARSIRRLESGNGAKRTPIIACTANALGGDAELCAAAGMDDYLVKPVELRQILKKLDRWLPIPEPAELSGTPSREPLDVVLPDSPLDPSVLAAILGGDTTDEREILMDFRRVNDQDAASLKQAVAAREVARIVAASHRIKGACSMVGALGLAGVCAHIERESRANDLLAVATHMGAFDHEWVRLNTYLDAV